MRQLFVLLFGFMLVANTSEAAVFATLGAGSFSSIDVSQDFETFFGSQAEPFIAGGFTFTSPGTTGTGLTVTTAQLGMPTRHLYQNSGDQSLLHFQLTSGADFNQVQFDVSNGFNTPTTFAWIRLFNNGTAIGSGFDLDVTSGGTVTVWTDGATTFDEVRVGTYFTATIRNQHNAGNVSATAIDNIVAGTRGTGAVPEPATLAMFGVGALGLVGAALRRRKRAT